MGLPRQDPAIDSVPHGQWDATLGRSGGAQRMTFALSSILTVEQVPLDELRPDRPTLDGSATMSSTPWSGA